MVHGPRAYAPGAIADGMDGAGARAAVVTGARPVPPEVRIERLAHDGRGVAHRDGKTVFVDGALPGETVALARLKTHRRYDEAVAARVLAASPERSPAPCPHFGVCGGCALQHQAPPAQLAAKERALLEVLERVGGVRPRRLFPRIPGPALGYRRKARLGVKRIARKGRVVVGFREKNGRYVTDAGTCPVLAPPGADLPGLLAELIEGLTVRTQCPQVEFAAGDAAAAVVFRVLAEPSVADLRRLEAFARAHDLAVWLQAGTPPALRLVHGPALLSYALPEFDVTLHFLPTDFVQVNAAVNRALVAAGMERLGLGAGERVLELYSGLGNFTLALARRARSVVSVEGAPALVRRARANAGANGIGNVHPYLVDLAAPAGQARWLRGPFDAAVLDPPRSGSRALVPRLRRLSLARVLYVSCHPGTLARDAAELVAAGFTLDAVGVADMFPHTAHAEAMALFTN